MAAMVAPAAIIRALHSTTHPTPRPTFGSIQSSDNQWQGHGTTRVGNEKEILTFPASLSRLSDYRCHLRCWLRPSWHPNDIATALTGRLLRLLRLPATLTEQDSSSLSPATFLGAIQPILQSCIHRACVSPATFLVPKKALAPHDDSGRLETVDRQARRWHFDGPRLGRVQLATRLGHAGRRRGRRCRRRRNSC